MVLSSEMIIAIPKLSTSMECHSQATYKDLKQIKSVVLASLSILEFRHAKTIQLIYQYLSCWLNYR